MASAAAAAAPAAPDAAQAQAQAAFLAGVAPDSLSPMAQQLLQDTRALFEQTFGKVDSSSLSCALAPGRVNLIGEHTDYNDGFVMPLAIDRHTVVLGRRNGLQKFRIVSGNAPQKQQHEEGEDEEEAMEDAAAASAPPVVLEFDAAALVAVTADRAWHNYFRGVVAQFIKNGHSVPCFDVAIRGNVPLGGGLSSSASLEVATASFLQALLGLPLDGTTRALWCQRCEHEYCNVPCGVMDQFISSLAQKDHVMLLDCRSFQPTLVPFTDPSVALLVVNSNLPHGLGDGQYEKRVKECAEAVSVLQMRWPEVRKLRDASLQQLGAFQNAMDDIPYIRARHVITENDRTVSAADLLRKNDYASLGRLMNFSHVSMMRDYEVSLPAIDALVDIALEQPGVYGSRMTGGGFGGCTVSLVEASKVEQVAEAIVFEYKEKTGVDATTLITRPGPGAQIVKLA